MSDKYGFIIENDFLKILEGIKVQEKLNSQETFLKANPQETFFKRRSEFAALTREGYSMPQIAKKFNISRQAVSLALRKAAKEGQIVHKTRKSLSDNTNYVIISRKKKTDLQELICTECNQSFSAIKKRKTCSKNCFIKSRQKNGAEWSRIIFLDLTCNGCGANFKRSRYLQKINESKKKTKNYYCSRDCYYKSTKHKTIT